MRAVRYHKPKDIRVDEVEEPRLQDDRDAILRVTSTAICGSDLHIYNGMIPQLKPMTLGHEFMGIVEEVGPGVTNLSQGDRVVVPFPIADGNCFFCTRGLPTQCENSNPNYGPEGGLLKGKNAALYGYTDLYGGYDGGQAEMVRVPFADYGPRKIPSHLTDEEALFLTDIFPTGWTAIDWANLKGGETVAIFGMGPVGIMAAKAAKLMGAGHVIGVDIEPYRLEIAERAAGITPINADEEDPVETIRGMTEGRGADVCVDAVGMEAHRNILEKASAVIHVQRGSLKVFNTSLQAVRRGGTLSVVGVYGTPYDNFPLHTLFDKEVQLKLGQAPVHNYIDHLIELVSERKVRLDDIITHTLPLDKAPEAYKMFNEKKDNCLKVVLKP